ncbi:hypothetical protein G1H11_16515 [Phytoactinopolyspora alkaliphila]|uniref:Uncharacterized protein n=1 Tax=Phytoactinopolyspora alkaliphila TaxID=1783498 RepID=A0A6N9YPC0_9ACTN|nr:hypothetical protein [Phytoactinopolyspora alkaliphila]NED96911.1 hypothetical protein [Phytoactinopolyspora alkaliphila]
MLRRRRQNPEIEGLWAAERVLVRADGPQGPVAATDQRLIWADGSIAWHEIERASWDGDDEVLTVEPVATSGRKRVHRLPIATPGRLVDVVRERVVASVVISRHVPLRGRRGVRVTGRRQADGELIWSAVLDPGIDMRDAETRHQVDTAVAAVRHEVEVR